MEYLFAAAVAICIFAAVILVRAFWAGGKPITANSLSPLPQVDMEKASAHLSGAIQISTVSYRDRSRIDYGNILRLHEYLEATYPEIHRVFEKEVVNRYNLLFRWKGTNPSKEPVAFLAHLDTVPVEPSTLASWTHEPFSGEIADGCIWGRGAIDDKGQMIAVLEAFTHLIHSGFHPQCDVYLAFAHDEELMSSVESGALDIAHLLQSRGIRLRYVVDEGGSFCDGGPMGVDGKLALISICEKGYVDIQMTAHAKGGHASMPQPHTALGALCTVGDKIERHPMKPEFTVPSKAMFRYLLPFMGMKNRILHANLWLFSSYVKRILCRHPMTSAIMRSTCAVTMSSGSSAPNVLPQQATLTVNMRVAPGKTVEDMCAYIEKFAGKDIDVDVLTGIGPSPVSSVDSNAFHDLLDTVSEVYPGHIAAPYPLVFGTDSRHYSAVCDDVYRFTPFECMERMFPTMHGLNERIEIESLQKGIQFFIRFIEKSCK